MKSQIENRLIAVTGYTGTQDLPWMISQSLPPQLKLGSDPNWAVARACMNSEEYAAFGRDGKPWKFLRNNHDRARIAIEAARAVVAQRCNALQLQCDWSKIPPVRTHEPVGKSARAVVARTAESMRMPAPKDDQISEAAAFELLSEEREQFRKRYPGIMD